MLFYVSDLIALGCINGIMVVALNLQYGFSGLLNVALYSYVAVGAYVASVTTMGHSQTPNVTYILGWTLPWYVGLLLGGLAATAVGALVFSFSVRRLRSDYLAIVTVSTAFILWNVFNSAVPLFDGANGLFNVPPITGAAQISTEGYALILGGLALLILAACVLCSRRIYRSPYGRVLRSIREDETVAAAFGQKIWPAQLWVFLIGSFMAGIAGGLFVYYLSAWSPSAFQPLESFVLLAALIIGGSGNYWGALLGAFVVIEGLNEFSRFVPIPPSVNQLAGAFRGIVIGVVLILVLRYRPAGLIPRAAAAVVQGDSASVGWPAGCEPAPGRRSHLNALLPSAGAAARGQDTLLEIRDVGYAYGGVWAVQNCSMTIGRGLVTGLIGPNGAGKSTLIELVSGFLKPMRGSILFDGEDTTGWGPARTARSGIIRTFQIPRLLPRLPVLENVMLAAMDQAGESPLRAIFWPRGWMSQEASLREEALGLLHWLGLEHHLEKPAGTLSGGQARLLEIARALAAHPRILLLDEPTAGVYPETSRLIATRVREIAEQGVTILLIAHNMSFLSSVADDVVVMAEGSVLTRGTPDAVRSHEQVVASYLGKNIAAAGPTREDS